MSMRALALRPAVLIVVAFVLVQTAVLAVSGPSFLSSDERYGYTQSASFADTGEVAPKIPFAYDAGEAFVAMGSGAGGNNTVEGGVSALFVAAMSPFAAFGAWGAAIGGIAFSALLLVGIILLMRETATERIGVVAAGVTAVSLPIMFWSPFFMANIATVALFVLAMAALARLAKTRNTGWAVVSVALVTLTVGMRRDSLPLVLPLLVMLVILARRQPMLWLFVAGGFYLAIAAYRLAVGLATDVQSGWFLSASDVTAAFDSLIDRFTSYHPAWTWQDLATQTTRLGFGLYPVLAVAALVGLLGLRQRTGARRHLVIAFLLVMGLGYLWTAMTITASIFHDPPGAFSSLVRYSLLGTVALGVLAAMTLPLATRAWSGGAGRAAAVALVVLLVAPTALHSALAEPGVLWSAEMREARYDIDQRAARLPENAFLVGDEVSKYVTSRLVLSGDHAFKPLDRYLPPLVDRLADRHGLRAFVHHDTFHGDWWGPYGEHVTDANHVTIEWPEDPAFYEVIYTNTTLRNIGVLGASAWELDASGRLASIASVAKFRPTPTLAKDLVEAPSPALRWNLTYLDDDTAQHSLGYVNAPHTVNDLRVVHKWRGGGTGEWRTISVLLPADTVTNGNYYVSGGLTLRELTLQPVGSVVEP